MRSSLRVRFTVMLGICGLVGLGLAVTAGGNDRWRPRGTVVTTSSGVLSGGFRGSSSSGIVLGVGERVRVVPWDAVSGVSFADGSPVGVPAAPRGAAGKTSSPSTAAPTGTVAPGGPVARGGVRPSLQGDDGPAS